MFILLVCCYGCLKNVEMLFGFKCLLVACVSRGGTCCLEFRFFKSSTHKLPLLQNRLFKSLSMGLLSLFYNRLRFGKLKFKVCQSMNSIPKFYDCCSLTKLTV